MVANGAPKRALPEHEGPNIATRPTASTVVIVLPSTRTWTAGLMRFAFSAERVPPTSSILGVRLIR
jgi:hypothetical protein